MIEWLIYALFIAGLYLFYKLCRLIGSLIDRLTSYIKGDETEHVHKAVERETYIRPSRNNEERPSRKSERPNSSQRECQPTQKPIHEVRRSAFDHPERYCPRVIDVSLPCKEEARIQLASAIICSMLSASSSSLFSYRSFQFSYYEFCAKLLHLIRFPNEGC